MYVRSVRVRVYVAWRPTYASVLVDLRFEIVYICTTSFVLCVFMINKTISLYELLCQCVTSYVLLLRFLQLEFFDSDCRISVIYDFISIDRSTDGRAKYLVLTSKLDRS